MGNYASKRKKVGYSELRESIPGSLVSDHDFNLFYSLCRIESARTISTLLHPSSTQLFFVVISGEVEVHLTNTELKNRPILATVFRPGEVIHFFNIPLKSNSVVANIATFEMGECLQNGNIKMSLHFSNGLNSTARVIGMDRTGLNEFLITAQNNTHALRSFLELTVSELPTKSPFFKTITPDQMAILGPLIKVRLSHVGSVISPYTTEMAIQCQRIGTELSPKSRKEPSVANYGPAGEVALLFSGSALSVPFERNLAHITQKLLEQNATHQQHNTLVHRTSSLLPINRLYPATKSSGLSSLPPPIFYPTPPPQPQPGDSDKSSTNAADRARIQVTILPGTFMGLSEFYCRDPRVVPRACLASAPSVVGYLDLNALDSLFSVDPRFERVIKRNYHMLVMSWLKPTVPLLRDMDEWSFALLSCKVFIRCYLADANIYRKGDPSDFAYIMLCGSVKEVTDSGSPKNATPTASSGKLKSVQIERIMNWGTLFGEVALATNNPYFNTTTTQEPTMVLCISKHVLEQIYNNNKAKLCEIRIRLLGGDAALQHVVDHPRGCQLFQAYLDKEMAGENLRFYTAVDRYDAMCKEVVKQYNAVQKLRTENAELLKDLLTITPTEPVPQDAASRHSYAVDQGPGLTQDKKLTGGLTLLSPHSAPDRPNRIRNNVNNGDNGESKHNSISENVNDGIADEGMEQNRSNSAEQATNNNNNNPVPADTDPCHSEDNPYHNNTMGMHLHRSATNSTTVSTSHHTVDDTVPAIAHSLLSHLPASVPNSTQSSFAMSSTKTSVSDKSMIHYMTGGYQYDSAFNTKHSSIDMTNFGNEQDVPEERTPEQENSSNKDSVMSYGSMRSADSNKSDHFILSVTPNAHLDANNKHSLNSSGGANSALTHNNLHGVASQNHHNNHTHHHNGHHKGVVVKKPVLESIISESNFSVMSSEPDEDGSTKFSLKVKPTPQVSISAAAYSSKIAPLIENEDENEPDNDEIHDGARAGGSASPFTIASIRKAMQYAASVVVDGSSAINSARREDTYGLSPRRTDSINNNQSNNQNNNNKHAVSPKHSLTLGTLPALPPSQYDTPAVVKDASSVNSGGSQQDAMSVVVPERVADPEKAKEVARNITQKLHRIQKNIVELKQVARSIMQTYIYNGSEMQLNLPDALRMRTEKSFKVWSANLMASVTVDSWDDREARRSEVSVKVPTITEKAVIPANNQEAVVGSAPHNTATTHAGKPVYNKFGSMAFLESIIPGGLQIVIKSTDSADTGASDAPRVIALEQSAPNPSSATANQQLVPQYKTDNYIVNNNLRTPLSGAGISGTTTTASSSVSSNPFTPLQLRVNTDTTRSGSDFPLLNLNLNSDSADTMDTGFGSIQIQPTPLQYPNAITKPIEVANANTHANTNSTSSYHITVPKQIRPFNAPTIANSGPLPTQPNNSATTDAQLHFDADMNIDLSFIDLFKEPKAEILRLLRDDKFPRFKNTNQFASFIANVKPYEKESFFDQSLIKSGHNDRYSLDFDLSR